jgi:hypothetical protein
LHGYSQVSTIPRKERLLIFPNNEYMPITPSPSLPLSLYDIEAMALSSWLCSSSSKNTVVKIVFPGGHAELHDRPVSGAEVMLRNPRSCVAHPHVFQQPWAVVAPDTMLMPGQKFYVVPIKPYGSFSGLLQSILRRLHRFTKSVAVNLAKERRRKKSMAWFIRVIRTLLIRKIAQSGLMITASYAC